MKIAVLGSGKNEDPAAERLGQLLAKAGHIIVTGGYDGVMASASKGAKEAGGQAIGIVLADKPVGNNHLTQTIMANGQTMTEQFGVRLGLLLTCQVLVFFDGEVGTLAELFAAINLKIKTGSSQMIILIGRGWGEKIVYFQELGIPRECFEWRLEAERVMELIGYIRTH